MITVYIGENQYVDVEIDTSKSLLPIELGTIIDEYHNKTQRLWHVDTDKTQADMIINYYMMLIERYNSYIHPLNKYDVEEQLQNLHPNFFRGLGKHYIDIDSIYQRYKDAVGKHNQKFEPTPRIKSKHKPQELEVQFDYNIKSPIPSVSSRIIKTTKRPKVKDIPKTSRFIRTKDKTDSGSDIESDTEQEPKLVISPKPKIKTKQELLDAEIKPKQVIKREPKIKTKQELLDAEIKPKPVDIPDTK